MSTITITPPGSGTFEYSEAGLSGTIVPTPHGQYVVEVVVGDESTTTRHDGPVPKAVAFAIAGALDSGLVDPFDLPRITTTMIDLVESAADWRGTHENTGGGTMAAVWHDGGICAVMGDHDHTVGLYNSAVWNGDTEGEHFALAAEEDTYTGALRAIVRFIEQA